MNSMRRSRRIKSGTDVRGAIVERATEQKTCRIDLSWSESAHPKRNCRTVPTRKPATAGAKGEKHRNRRIPRYDNMIKK